MLTHDFYFQNFLPKNLAKKLGRVLQPEISGMVCVRVRSCSTPPPFPADEKYPRGSFPEARISRRGIRPSLGLVTSFMPGSATFLPHLTIRLPAYDAIAGVEAWAAGGIW